MWETIQNRNGRLIGNHICAISNRDISDDLERRLNVILVTYSTCYTVVTLCAQLTRDLLVIALFLVSLLVENHTRMSSRTQRS